MNRPGFQLRWAWLRAAARVERLLAPVFGKPADWDRRTYSRKLRWRCRHPDPGVDYANWADKARAKEVVRDLLPVAETFAVFHRPEEVLALEVPPTYVMKATHGWNMSLLVEDGIVRGGNRGAGGAGLPADVGYLRRTAEEWLGSKTELRRQARERHYALLKPGFLLEEYLGPIDHEVQLFLFRGRLRMAMVFYRGFRHDGATHRLYDEEWRLLDPGDPEFAALYERRAPPAPRPPRDLLDGLESVCRPLDHVRVDLFALAGRYFFGEFTFTHSAGRAGYVGKYDAELGRHWTR